MKSCCITAVFWLAVVPAFAGERADILIADFEGKDYGDWKTTGSAFGAGPARSTLPNQMPVGGFLGKGLVNTYFNGDGTTGTLTSPPFRVERKHLNFLIGGGNHPGQTCINLLLDGKVIRTATGPNDRPGGSEQLDWHSWDVADLAGKTVVIEIVDRHTGGWGHINIDHIYQSDKRRQNRPVSRDLVIESRYLHLPVKNGAPKRRMRFEVDGQTVREFEIELAEDKADFWAFSDVGAFRGKRLKIVTVLPDDSKALEAITASDRLPGEGELYREKHRPQFHFTSRRGWLNDPNGLVNFDGEYHLFYQHNPYGWNWGNMHWGHAVSTDLVHWKELPLALYPRQFGDWCFSGSALVDKHNSSGFGKGGTPPLVLAYTSTGRGECIAYSTDRGRTWTEFAGNPVVKHAGRDPKLLWHEPTRRWVMAVYDETEGRAIAFYSSPDLKRWTFESRIADFYECPDLFPLPVDGDPKKQKWALYGADGKYLLGQFDGRRFHKESGKHQLWHGNFYAAQTFANAPDGRRIQIGWGSGITFPGMPFNQQMTVPCALTLGTTGDGVRMFAQPVKEIDKLHEKKHAWRDRILRPGENPLAQVKGQLFDLRTEVEPTGAEQVGFSVRGVRVAYDVKKQQIICKGHAATLRLVAGKVRLQLLIDRGSIEVFGNDGQVALSVGVIPPDDNRSLQVFTTGGDTKLHTLEVCPLRPAWK